MYLGTVEQYDETEQAIVSYVCLKGAEAREVSKGKNEGTANKEPCLQGTMGDSIQKPGSCWTKGREVVWFCVRLLWLSSMAAPMARQS